MKNILHLAPSVRKVYIYFFQVTGHLHILGNLDFCFANPTYNGLSLLLFFVIIPAHTSLWSWVTVRNGRMHWENERPPLVIELSPKRDWNGKQVKYFFSCLSYPLINAVKDALEGKPTAGPSTGSPGSTSPASTSPTPSPTSSGECHAVGVWAGKKHMDQWCNLNCPKYCPPDYCACD